MRRLVARPGLLFAVLLVLLAATAAASVLFGSVPIDLSAALSGPGTDRLVLLHERIPRTAIAAAVGAALSVAGLAFQAVLANPLADPYVVGVAGGAAIGGTLAMVLPVAAWVGPPAVSAGAFLGGLGAILLTWRLSRDRTGRMRAYEVLLVGVVFNTFASAVVMFLKAIVRAEKTQEMLLWLMGTLSSEARGPVAVGTVTLATAVGIGLLWPLAPALNALAMGEEDAARVGVDPDRVTKRVLAVGSLLVAAAVSVAGMIGFVGLVVPHAVRAIAGPDHRVGIPATALLGAAFLICADLLTRLAFPVFETEAPVGVLTALVGGPAFVWLLKRRVDR
ncbi:MAG: iron ABC transporter permease [Deltaproteobacteria bacterium]|nr:iron ABC transporter permease [Deltaproteobacteria bacterium]